MIFVLMMVTGVVLGFLFTKCCRKAPRFRNGDIRRLIQYLYAELKS